MAHKIHLLPDKIANQIAAGEVVQRPASVVKELLENSIDAGADSIHLLVKDGGSTLIQVIDNGNGMDVTDARMCWERHATSKIQAAEDLFRIRSFGFRGEALASIAAVSQVEMSSRRAEDEVGTFLRIEGSEFKEQTPKATVPGTNIAVRNLFYNIPARRNFLKSISVETRHIMDEFVRVAMAHHDIAFSFYNNDKEVYNLNSEQPAARIAALLSKKNQDDFLVCNEQHDMLNISGYLIKPEASKKTRGEQFLFVNNRFIKDPYLNHAITNAFDTLLPRDSFAGYVLFFEMNPSRIDINVSPTKTEIKFEDEKSIYSLLRSAVKKTLGIYAVTPEIPLEIPMGVGSSFTALGSSGTLFKNKSPVRLNPEITGRDMRQVAGRHWHKLFETIENNDAGGIDFKDTPPGNPSLYDEISDVYTPSESVMFGSEYLITRKNNELIIIDVAAAMERIDFDYHMQNLEKRQAPVQQLLFPRTVELKAPDFILVMEMQEDIRALGFDIAEFGSNCIIINGVPAETLKGSEQAIIEDLIENFKHFSSDNGLNQKQKLARALSRRQAPSKPLEQDERDELLKRLFACREHTHRPGGKPVYLTFSMAQLNQLLR